MDDDNLSDLSSDLSSVRSMSPLTDYPTPASSQDSDSIQVASCPISRKRALEEGGQPGAKKRRRAEPKPRTTEHLNLSKPSNRYTTEVNPPMDLLMKVLRKRRKIVVIVGAGISVSAGSTCCLVELLEPTDRQPVPDFRSTTGLFNTLRSEHKLKASGKHLFDASVYQTDSSTSSFHDMVRSMSRLVSAAKPTAFHQMLSTLASEGRLMRLYTQNVDGIDVALPSLETSVPLSMKGPWPRTIQLHGGLEKMVCSKCNHLSDFEAALFDGPEPPPCGVCVETDKVRTDHAGKRSHGIGKLRPRIVLYNEHNPDEEAIGAVVGSDLRSRPDAVIVVGTSMKIPGVRRIVREMCGVVRGRKDGLAVWINQEAPPVGKEFEDCWDLIVKGACDEVARHWSDEKDSTVCTESEVEEAKRRTGEVKVIIGSSSHTDTSAQGIPTPEESPRLKPRIILKVNPPAHYSLMPLQAKTETKSKSGKPTLKSASKSTKISTTIKKLPKKTSTKAPPKALPKIPPKASSHKINSNFKITKSTKPLPKAPKDIYSKPTLSLECSSHRSSTAMFPLSPSAARNNGPVTLPQMPLPVFPNLSKSQSTTDDPLDDPDRLKRRGSDIVSPVGTIPKDMANLLN